MICFKDLSFLRVLFGLCSDGFSEWESFCWNCVGLWSDSFLLELCLFDNCVSLCSKFVLELDCSYWRCTFLFSLLEMVYSYWHCAGCYSDSFWSWAVPVETVLFRNFYVLL